jgi:hypothetical protein
MKLSESLVTVTIPVPGAANREITKTYTRQVYEIQDVLEALQTEDKAKYILDRFNYGHDLAQRNRVRAEIVAAEAGPDNAVAKLVAQITKQRAAVGKPVSEEEAVSIAKTILGVE